MEILPEYLLLHYSIQIYLDFFQRNLYRIRNQTFLTFKFFKMKYQFYLCIFTANRTLIVESNCLQNGSWTPVEFNCVPNEDQIRRHGNKR